MNLDEAILQLEELVSQIREASFADDKTPLKNSLALQNQVKLIESGQSELDVIVFGDLNGFKSLNDLHGHEAGDIALKRVGETIQQDFVNRLDGKAFRRSGDEFVILLTQNMLPKFRKGTAKFSSIEFSYKGITLDAKMSFGLVVSDGKTDFSDLLERAEIACSVAKSKGHGVSVAWSLETAREASKEFRQKCEHCGSTVRCSVPNRNEPKALVACPFCEIRFFDPPE